jgi:hypothetical protein
MANRLAAAPKLERYVPKPAPKFLPKATQCSRPLYERGWWNLLQLTCARGVHFYARPLRRLTRFVPLFSLQRIFTASARYFLFFLPFFFSPPPPSRVFTSLDRSSLLKPFLPRRRLTPPNRASQQIHSPANLTRHVRAFASAIENNQRVRKVRRA